MRLTSMCIIAFLAMSVVLSGSVLAAPAAQTLWPDSTVQCQLLDSNTSMDPHDAVYSAVAYGTGGGADTNGEYLFWGNATSASAGTFGVGVLKLGLSDPIGELGAYYNVSFKAALMLKCGSHYEEAVVPSGDYLSVRFGVGYYSETLGYYEQMEPDYQPTSGSGGTNIHTSNPGGAWEFEHDLEERPFSLAEVRAMYMIIWLRFDSAAFAQIPEPSTPKSLLLLYVQAGIFPEEYTPPPEDTPSVGSFILRPDDDTWTDGDIEFTEPTAAASINETNYHSDGDLTFINKSDTLDEFGQVLCSMSDPPSWLSTSENRYSCYLWVIARDDDPTGPEKFLSIGLGVGGAFGVYQAGPDLQDGWYNNTPTSSMSLTTPIDYPGGAAIDWDYDDLVAMRLSIIASGASSISQLAVLCILSYNAPSDNEFEGVVGWLGQGHGVLTMMGIFGFLGLIAVPVVAAWSYKEGNDGLGVAAGAIVLMVLFGGFFIVGLSGSWG